MRARAALGARFLSNHSASASTLLVRACASKHTHVRMHARTRRRCRTGFEETKDFPIRMNDLIAGRYQVMDFLGSAAFSRAIQVRGTGGAGGSDEGRWQRQWHGIMSLVCSVTGAAPRCCVSRHNLCHNAL